MARFYSELNESHRAFIQHQPIFFTATAPTTGRINLSPKGMDSFRVLDSHTAGYLDLTGSGNETAAHLRENGRFAIMFCSFDEDPLILRLYGHGEIVRRQDADWGKWRPAFPDLPGERQIMLMHIHSVQTSCGYAVPLMDLRGQRVTLARWAEKKGTHGLLDYWREKNRVSIDGLPSGLLEE
jgi:hypothetical protein